MGFSIEYSRPATHKVSTLVHHPYSITGEPQENTNIYRNNNKKANPFYITLTLPQPAISV
jgi:hypothetical protein